MNELNVFKVEENDFQKGGTNPGKLVGTRYVKPVRSKTIPERRMKYRNAQGLAGDLVPERGMRVFVLLDGTFIAGDFIEAFITLHNLHVKRLTISTLSLSENNVDSLANLLDGEFVDKLDVVVSDYFFSHERRNLVAYMYKELDKDDKFQLAACASHCKLTLIETHCGLKIVIHGSANLRSSQNLEHICIEENPALYDFNIEAQDAIIQKYFTIKKSVRHTTLWQAVAK